METNPNPESVPRLSVQQYLDLAYSRQITRIAEHLHRYADRIQQLSMHSFYDRDGRARHVSNAADVLSELRAMNGTMAMLDQLVANAGDAQREADKTREAQS